MNLFIFSTVLILYYFIHSLLADNRIKNIMIERRIIRLSHYRLFYNIVAITLLIPILYTYYRVPNQVLFKPNFIFQLLGIWLAISGLVLVYAATRQYDMREFYGISYLNQETIHEHLNTKGLNRYVRHPLYTGAFLFVWGLFLGHSNYAHLAIAVITSIYILIGIQLEERKLLKTFGEAYRQYKENVPMLFPRISSK